MKGSSWGESIPEEWVAPEEETEGEWAGCYRGEINENGMAKFLSPISVGSRGVGECHYFAHGVLYISLFFFVAHTVLLSFIYSFTTLKRNPT